jgi:uncharacterized membrane protein YecN with MAPEG domain
MTIWLPISLTMAGCAALINLWLSIRVGRVRSKEKVFVGDGGNEMVIRRMRAHSNFVENAPFVLILIALLELACGQSMWLWGAGGLFLLGRLAHAIGMDGKMQARFVGTLITLVTLLALAGAAIYVSYAKEKPAEASATAVVS